MIIIIYDIGTEAKGNKLFSTVPRLCGNGLKNLIGVFLRVDSNKSCEKSKTNKFE